MAYRTQDGIENKVKRFAHVFRKEAQHQITVLLQQLVFAPIAAVRDRICQMLSRVHEEARERSVDAIPDQPSHAP